MKYAKLDENGVVIQVQPYTEKGFIKVDDTVHCGMVQTADGFVVPPLSTEQLKEQDIEAAQQYLRDTDFYMTLDKYATLDEDKKQKLTRLRQEARDTINQLKSNL